MVDKLPKARRKVLIQLESILGNECYNASIQNYGAGGAADERNCLYYKMWGSSTAYRGGVGCLFFFFAKRIL